MSSGDNLVVWVVDENGRELRTSVAALQRAIQGKGNVEFKPLQALPRMENYLTIIGDPVTAAMLLDQRLQTRGGIDHTGIELALYLRSIDKNLPIYILTGYVTEDGEPNDEFVGNEWSVEDILDKRILNNQAELRTFIDRLIRRINVHQTIRDEREKRFNELLMKSLDSQLDSEEQEELDKLGLERMAAFAISDQIQRRQLESLFNKLDKRLSFLDKDINDKGPDQQ